MTKIRGALNFISIDKIASKRKTVRKEVEEVVNDKYEVGDAKEVNAGEDVVKIFTIKKFMKVIIDPEGKIKIKRLWVKSLLKIYALMGIGLEDGLDWVVMNISDEEVTFNEKEIIEEEEDYSFTAMKDEIKQKRKHKVIDDETYEVEETLINRSMATNQTVSILFYF